MELLITICARGGSKGIPGKNIRLLNGVPLIHYSIQTARRFAGAIEASVDIALSTDSDQIREVAGLAGLQSSYKRPDHLAGDSAGKVDAISDVKHYYEQLHAKSYDLVLDLDVSSPLRSVADLLAAYQSIVSNEAALNLFSVNKANKNPYFNMVEEGKDGFFYLSKSPEQGVLSRQTAPKVYELNASFYFYKKAFFDLGFRSVYSGKALVAKMDHICFDLDHEVDFEFLEFLMVNNKLDLEL